MTETKSVYASRLNGEASIGQVLDGLPECVFVSMLDVTWDTRGWEVEVELTYDPNDVSFTYWAIYLQG